MGFSIFKVFFICFFLSQVLNSSRNNNKISIISKKAKDIVEAAHSFVKSNSNDMKYVQKMFSTDSRFKDDKHGLYLFMHVYDRAKQQAICCAQGIRHELIGKNMWHLRSPNGRLLFHEFEEMIETQGEGWIEYEWLNPYLQKIQTKLSFLKKIILKDGQKAWVGCGFWKD